MFISVNINIYIYFLYIHDCVIYVRKYGCACVRMYGKKNIYIHVKYILHIYLYTCKICVFKHACIKICIYTYYLYIYAARNCFKWMQCFICNNGKFCNRIFFLPEIYFNDKKRNPVCNIFLSSALMGQKWNQVITKSVRNLQLCK